MSFVWICVAAGASANPEDIDIDNSEEIELEDEADDEVSGAVDESPPDKLVTESSSGQQEALPETEESMFAAVEIHSFDSSAAVNAQGHGTDQALPTALANILQRDSGT